MSQEKPILVHVNDEETLRSIDLILLQVMRGGGTRLKILEILKAGDKTCNEVSSRVQISWGSTSHHLAKMKEAGLVLETPVGRIRYYRPTLWGHRALEALLNGHDE